MDTLSNKASPCPVGETACDRLDELARLHQRVDELSELVSRDPLTGLFNYRHFADTLDTVLERTRRSGRPSCLVMLDLDHFKQINDTWGHEVGNIALKQAARILRQQTRMVDIVCRYGGEEFAVILPDTGLRQAIEVAQRVRHAIEEAPVVHEGGEFNFTASMGVDIYQPHQQLSGETFVEATDQLLYQAKQNGRNQVAHRNLEDVESQTNVSKEERDALRELFASG